MRHRFAIPLASLLVLAACSLQDAPQPNALVVDVTPDTAHVTIVGETEYLDYGYGDVQVQGLAPGTYEILVGDGGELFSVHVEVRARVRTMARIDLAAHERVQVRYEAGGPFGPFDWHGRMLTLEPARHGEPGGGGGGGSGGGGGPGGNPGGPGGNPGGAGGKGGDYGDLWVIKRDLDGAPVYEDHDGVLCVIPLDADGNEIDMIVSIDGPEPKCEPAPGSEELVQEVEFGRLNMVRSPEKVLAKAFDAAMATLLAADEGSLTTDAAGRLLVMLDGVPKTIDSPLENVALYQEMIMNLMAGDTPLPGVTLPAERTPLEIAAALFAAGADKTGDIDLDEVIYINDFLGLNVEDGDPYYAHFTSFSYDRDDRYGEVTAELLVFDPVSGTYSVEDVDISDAVFGDVDATDSNARGFAMAADDAVHVIDFIHLYAVP